MKEIARKARKRGLKIALVPTMGGLHKGHASLIRYANEAADVLVTSLFVNPAQFGPGEDYQRYPRDLTRDSDQCISLGVDYLFTPEVNDIYPPGPRTYVEVKELSDRLEGHSRPGHFRGVATIVLKLLEIVQPHVAVFGWKDAQQGILIRRMVQDLMLDVEIHLLPIIRDEDGVALSSRNRFLTDEQRAAAQAIPRALEAARHAVAEGQTKPEEVIGAAREVLEATPLLRVDYVELATKDQLAPVTAIGPDALLLIAVYCGDTRLIDNTLLEPSS